MEENNQTHLSKIENFLRAKYSLHEPITTKNLDLAQKEALFSEIRKKNLHEKLYKAKLNPLMDIKDSSYWLKHGNNKLRDEEI